MGRTLDGQLGQRQIAVAEHAGEQIVEIVRGAAGKRTDRLHLLHLTQLIFTACQRPLRFAPGRDVDSHGQPTGTPQSTG